MMRGLCRWLPGAALLLGVSSLHAQPSTVAVESTALPGGAVVGSVQYPPAATPIISAAQTGAGLAGQPMPAGPSVPGPGAMPPELSAPLLQEAATPALTPATPPNGWSPGAPISAAHRNPLVDCCGPIGGNGPIGQEYYFRAGRSFVEGDDQLARNLKDGWTGQIGARAQFFNPSGDTAWALDAHVTYTYNQGTDAEIITLKGEPVTVHTLHRTAVGLGLGRDWFLYRPGFILDTWDANFRLGVDAGGRWGAGHVDFRTPFEIDGYRRRYDVFGQVFGGVMGTMEVPMGGWISLVGIRVECVRTFSDLLQRQANFDEINAMLILGVRY